MGLKDQRDVTTVQVVHKNPTQPHSLPILIVVTVFIADFSSNIEGLQLSIINKIEPVEAKHLEWQRQKYRL